MNLTTEADLADKFGLTVEKTTQLRQRHQWPHVRLTRFDVRYTDAQIAEIVASRTVKPKAPVAGESGLTDRSARRAS